MKLKRILFFTLFIILCIGMSNSCMGEDGNINNLNFTYKGTNYNINVGQIAKEKNINIEDYPYYFVVKEKGESAISICYSQKRTYAGTDPNNSSVYRIYGSDPTLKISIEENGSVTGKIVDLAFHSLSINKDIFVVTNHDIFCGSQIAYNRNHGYEYDSSQESTKVCNDIMKVTKQTKVYEKAAMNYNEITTLSLGDVVKRIAYSVNTVNGHTWDKIVLSNGTEGYIFTDNLEKATEYENIHFEYNEKNYNLYFLSSKYEINLNDYPYYFITKETKTSSAISIYYSQKRTYAGTDPNNSSVYRIYGSDPTLKISIEKDGSVTGKIVDLAFHSLSINKDIFVVTNHDIFCGSQIAYNRNHGYEYDSSQESTKVCNDIMKVTKQTKVYEKAAMNYNEITTLSLGDVVKRIAYSVNTVNGHTWDKIVLSNGTEGYVFTDNLEKATEYENIHFRCNEKNYSLYFSPSQYGIALKDFPYYLVAKEEGESDISIYYSQKKITASYDSMYRWYRITGSESALEIKIKPTGLVSGRVTNLSRGSTHVIKEDFIVANHDILQGNTIFFNRNHGYLEKDYISTNGLYFSTDSGCFYNIDTTAETNIIEGELEHNSVSITEEERKTEIEKRQLGITLSNMAYEVHMKDAANNLLYFLTSGEQMYTNETGKIYSYEEGYYKTGHTAKEMLFENAIRDMNEPKEMLNSSINSMIEAAENIIVKNTDKQPIYCYTEINGQCPAPNLDWFMAVYNYRTRGSAVVSKEGDSYTMTFKYIMIDYYDWEEAEETKNWNPYIGAQTEFSKLNKYGLSRNYTNYDILNYTVTWKQGQRVGNGANVTGPGL